MDKHCEKHGLHGGPPRGFWVELMSIERRKLMDLVNFIVWLTAGAVIGWFANRMVNSQHDRRADKPTPPEDDSSEES